MYGLENLLLNQSENSSWYNFGYWPHKEITYEEACRNLALVLSEAAELSEVKTVFDIGGGCGDQQILWRRKYQLQRIHAINTSAPQVDFARTKISRAGLSQVISIELSDLQHAETHESYDCVISLDAAYHIDKSLLFARSSELTNNQGRLAFTDLVLEPGPRRLFSNLFLRLICVGSGIPFSNLHETQALQQLALRHGWHCKTSQNITESVLSGYVHFMRGQRKRIFLNHGLRSFRFILTGLLLGLIIKLRLLRYVVLVFHRK